MTDVKTGVSRGSTRPAAGREQMLGAARTIRVRKGWKYVTIRAVAQERGYTAPELYEHFRNEGILTQLAIEGHTCLERTLRDLLANSDAAVQTMVERY